MDLGSSVEKRLLEEQGVRKYVCPECKRPFLTPEELGAHLNFRRVNQRCELVAIKAEPPSPPPSPPEPESKPQPPSREEESVPKNEPLPPLSEAGPCRRGCGRQLGASAGPRAKHENRCDGTPKGGAAAEPKPARAARKANVRKAPPAAGEPADLVSIMRDRARRLRDAGEAAVKAGEKQIKQAARLEEVAEEFAESF